MSAKTSTVGQRGALKVRVRIPVVMYADGSWHAQETFWGDNERSRMAGGFCHANEVLQRASQPAHIRYIEADVDVPDLRTVELIEGTAVVA